MFNSCRDVQMPSTNERAIGVLCGHSPDDCTPQNWLDFMGSTANGQTPFTVMDIYLGSIHIAFFFPIVVFFIDDVSKYILII